LGPRSCQVCGTPKTMRESRCRVCGQEHTDGVGPLPRITGNGQAQTSRGSWLTGRMLILSAVALGLVAWLVLTPDPSLRWTFNLVDGARITTSPTIAGNLVLLGDSEGRVHAVDAETGYEKWVFGEADTQVTSDLVVTANTVIAVCGTSLFTLRLDTGTEIWHHIDTRDLGTPIVAQNEIVVSAGQSILSLSLTDGTPSWEFDTDDGHVPTVLSATSDTLYFGYSEPAEDGAGQSAGTTTPGGVYALDLESAQRIWVTKVKAAHGNLIITDSLIYGVDPHKRDGGAFALARDSGDIVWQNTEATTELALVDGRIFYSRQYLTLRDQPKNGEYAAVNAVTGKKLWSFKFNGSPVSNPVASADRVFVGTGSELVAIDPENGEIDWTLEVPDVVQQTPRLFADCLYLTCGSSSLCAVEVK